MQQNVSGSITIYWGPMYAGKTTALLQRYVDIRFNMASSAEGGEEDKLVLVKHRADEQRYSKTYVCTHAPENLSRAADIVTSDLFSVMDILEEKHRKNNDLHVFIDEAQFFPDLVKCCESLANTGIHVYLSMLSGTFHRTPWKCGGDILSLADNVIHLKADCSVCKKFDTAAFTKKIAGSKELLVDVGGAEKYAPMCRKCYFSE